MWVADDGPTGCAAALIWWSAASAWRWNIGTAAKSGCRRKPWGARNFSGAPLGLKDEFEPLGLDRTDEDENPIIAENAHVRLANATTNGGAEVLRRGYSYNDGVNFVAERWPPWRQGMEYDAGLLFVCYERDPRTGFIRIFENMARFDMLNQFVTHTGGGLFALSRRWKGRSSSVAPFDLRDAEGETGEIGKMLPLPLWEGGVSCAGRPAGAWYPPQSTRGCLYPATCTLRCHESR